MLEDGLAYPVRGDWIGRIVIGGLLGLLSILVIPAFLVVGYLVRVLEETIGGDEVPPEFTDWGDLLVTGVIGTIITVAYTVIPVVAYAVIVAVVAGTSGAIGGDVGALVGVVGLLLALAFVPVLFLVYYAVPAALSAYAARGELGAAFDPDLLKPALLSTEYLVAVLMPIVVAVLTWIATAVLANGFAQTSRLPLQPVRGQVSELALPAGVPDLARVVCAKGYVAPALEGVLTFGATFAPNDDDASLREADHVINLAELERTLPALVRALRAAGADLGPGHLGGRAAVRAASPDKSPYAGPVPDADAWLGDYADLTHDATRIPATPGRHHGGLWITAAHGSRGLASAPLCAELIASRICDEPMPLEQPLVDHLHPGRRLVRDLVQAKTPRNSP
jgi:tRNA 5-methylaminomethyl-2-thiouridine biosynthesis bifunctional protein